MEVKFENEFVIRTKELRDAVNAKFHFDLANSVNVCSVDSASQDEYYLEYSFNGSRAGYYFSKTTGEPTKYCY